MKRRDFLPSWGLADAKGVEVDYGGYRRIYVGRNYVRKHNLRFPLCDRDAWKVAHVAKVFYDGRNGREWFPLGGTWIISYGVQPVLRRKVMRSLVMRNVGGEE